ncbi:hypothetical protein ACFO1B_14040 [Dactylosporangium siamense]|uniref:CARDB domain-containing protein n=1 Tax=Dactylosporangium siamense TaxID=685454 RepID=A0A919PS24_9ACTN|nr:hypothetical protein [Dactylosporangium siamense]GIG49845.1 hypothetical protein Dsi01nite_078860 [Dactylosporangium siamense]
MAEFDDLISGALDDFRDTEAGTAGFTPGAATVRATVKRRRTVRLTTMSVLGALLIAAPIAAFAADPHGNNPPPTPGESVTTAPVPVSPSTSAAPSTSPSVPVSAPPDGRLTAAAIGAVKVTIPAYFYDECATKQVKLPAKDQLEKEPWIEKVVYTDLDGDQALETAALVYCRAGETPWTQVVGFDRDADGNIVVLGAVVAHSPYFVVADIRARTGGGIVADVQDIFPCCGVDPDDVRHQQREYGWDGTKVRQLAGPLWFGDPGRVTDLKLTVTDVVLGPVVDGKRTGTAKFTVKNNGSKPSGRFAVSLNCLWACGAGPAPFGDWVFGTYEAPHAPIAAGQQVTETITVTVAADFTGGTARASLHVMGLNDTKSIDDPNPDDNTATMRIRTS